MPIFKPCKPRRRKMDAKSRNARTSAMTTSLPALDDHEFVITRIINAPRELVFKAWTDPKQMTQWWGPKGFTNPVCEMDVRPGGAHRIVMRGPDGTDYPIKGIYREIVKPERIIFINSFSDEKGGLTRHPMSPSWPLEMRARSPS